MCWTRFGGDEVQENYISAILKKDGLTKCGKKHVKCLERVNGVTTKTRTVMTGSTKQGTYAVKKITIDDAIGKTEEIVTAVHQNGGRYEFRQSNLTGYRCAEMTVLAIEMLYHRPTRVGFIGTGKTNLLNCIAIKKHFDVDQIVIRGSKKNFSKNVGDFMTVCSDVAVDASEEMYMLNTCDVVVTCTNSCDKANLISTKQLYFPSLIVALDSGYILDESFRYERESYSDWPEQLEAHFKDEFVFDKNETSFQQMRYLDTEVTSAVAYLYGVGIADAVAAERLIGALERDGMERAFLSA